MARNLYLASQVLTTLAEPRPKSQFSGSSTSILASSKSNDALLRTVTLDQHSFHQSCENFARAWIIARENRQVRDHQRSRARQHGRRLSFARSVLRPRCSHQGL